LKIRHRPLTTLAVVMPRIAPKAVSVSQWRSSFMRDQAVPVANV